MKNSQTPPALEPWYRQFWPWFIIALPASVVVAGLITVYIAFANRDATVDDDYYREGLAINQSLAGQQRAADWDLQARVQFDHQAGSVVVELTSSKPLGATGSSIELKLQHPILAERDIAITLGALPDSDHRYQGELSVPLQDNYYLRLTGEQSLWRLDGQINFSYGDSRLLTAH
mgnify:CR=1 FL=1